MRAVHRGRDVLFAAREFQPDVIVLDVMLPDIDGFEVLERLRDARDEVRVLFLTARDSSEDRLAGLTRGGDDYLTKPFGVAELLARARILARTSARVAATPAGDTRSRRRPGARRGRPDGDPRAGRRSS